MERIFKLTDERFLELAFRERWIQEGIYYSDDSSEWSDKLMEFEEYPKDLRSLWLLAEFPDEDEDLDIRVMYSPLKEVAFTMITRDDIIKGYDEVIFNYYHVPLVQWITDSDTYKKIMKKLSNRKPTEYWIRKARYHERNGSGHGIDIETERLSYWHNGRLEIFHYDSNERHIDEILRHLK